MLEAFKKYWVNYFNMNGRTSRKDYWLAILVIFLISTYILYVTGFYTEVITRLSSSSYARRTATTPLQMGLWAQLWQIATFIPSFSMMVRRLHDTGKSAWYLFMSFIPIAGPIIILVFLCLPSKNEGNPYKE